jgi:hypothetical protein
MENTSAVWTSCGNPVGQPFVVTTTDNTNDIAWTDLNSSSPFWITTTDSNPIPAISSPPISIDPIDRQGKRVVKAPFPSLELILVEIAKVLREGGDILEVREIFERHKMKLVDHDGEVIFDSKDFESLENKGL